MQIASSNRVNPKFADTFFRKVFDQKEAIQDLLSFIGEPVPMEGTFQLVQRDPVLIGSRRNDLSFLWDQRFYYFFEQQSTENYNMPVRLLFYVSHALENYLMGKNLFQKKRIPLPEVKCYVLFTGITEESIEELETEQRLSEAYLSQREQTRESFFFDLELCVHCFHLKVTKKEMERFLEENEVPQRFRGIENTLIQYAMFVNTVKYELKEEQVETNTVRAKEIVLEICELFLERNYLVSYFQNQEVIDMAVEQLSYEEIIRFQEREEGREEGIKEGMERGIKEGIEQGIKEGIEQGIEKGIEKGIKKGMKEGEREKLKRQVSKKLAKGKSVETIAEELEDNIDTIWKVIIEIKKGNV